MSENKHQLGWLARIIEEQVSESSSLCLFSEFRLLLNPLQGHVLAHNLSGSWSPRTWSSESFNIKYKLTSLACQPREAASSHQCHPANIFVSLLSESMVVRCDRVTCLGEQNHEKEVASVTSGRHVGDLPGSLFRCMLVVGFQSWHCCSGYGIAHLSWIILEHVHEKAQG